MNDISKITQFGDFYQLDAEFDLDQLLHEVSAHDDKWAKYNPRKDWIKRDGLCILNERGECGPGPALDSLGEWNRDTAPATKKKILMFLQNYIIAAQRYKRL